MAIRNAPAELQLTPARKSELVRTLDNFFLQRIKDLYDLFFDEAEFRLFNSAQKAATNQQQTQLLETLTRLKRHRPELETEALSGLRSHAQSDSEKPPQPNTPEQLALIEHDVFEAQLILETMTRKADQRWFEPLYCLAKRYSLLSDKEIDTHDLPMGIVAVGRSIHNALQPHVPLTLLPIVLHAFDRTVFNNIGEIYDALNERLKQWNVLPNIEIDLWRELHQGKSRTQTAKGTPSIDDLPSHHEPSFEIPTADVDSDELFSTARQILQLIHHTPDTESADSDDRDAVLSMLAELKEQSDDSSTPLLERLQKHASDQHELAPAGASTDSLRFVDKLFTEIETALRNSPALLESLRKLQIPLARATIEQPELLGDAEHPVHQFVNLLVSLTAHTDLPNAPLEHKLSGVMKPIADDSNNPQDYFAEANADLAPLLAQQQKARERNIRRIIDTYQGQQQLARAHTAVDRELQRRNAHEQTPTLALQLLEQGWRHILTLAYMRNGDSGNEWSEYFALLDELLWRLGGAQSETLTDAAAMAQARSEGSHLADRIGTHLDSFFPGDYRNAVLIDALRSALLRQTEIETVATPWHKINLTSNPRELQQELDQAYPHLVRWFRRVRDFKAGDEFVHFKDPNLRERYTLVWVAENQQHFVFVNARGLKAFDFDLVDLANEMAKGLHPVGNQAAWPAMEQAILGTANDAYQQLSFNSTHDNLTELLNRKEFEHRLGNALLEAKNQQLQHALIYIDIDQFSLINNLLGHIAGDYVLKLASNIISEHCPSMAVLARTGSNEFAVLIEDCDLTRAVDCAEEIRRTIGEQPFTVEQHKLDVTASIGVIAITKYADGTVAVLRDAVAATNTAKELGRNRVYVLQSDVELHSRREKLLTWIDKMNDLLDNDYLVLRAQPIQPLGDSGTIQHYEILLGLRDENGSIIPPGEFIEAAECYNRMQRVDRWVIQRAFTWMAALADKQLPVPTLSINLSGNSLNDATFLDFLIDQFGNYRVAPSSICFEITETATIKNLTNAADFMHQIKKIGCSFALDDFGTGLSSYEYLKLLPVDYLKIDGMFIVDIAANASDYAMVKSINEIAHFMGKKTIAEFVESNEAITALREIGIDYAQGFHVGKPVLLSDL